MSTNDWILIVCGLHSLGFALFHLAFSRLFRWQQTLAETTLANRAILRIENGLLVYVFAAVAAACFLLPDALLGTTLGRSFLAAVSVFWVIRLVQQFVYLRVNQPMVHGLSVLFAIGAALFAAPLFL